MRTDKTTIQIGAVGENIACEFLVRKGFKIIARNYRKKYGEIDIIASKGNTLRFVEVKSLSCSPLPDMAVDSTSYRPEEQVHPAKLRKIARVAEVYVMEHNDQREYQIDVVGVFMDAQTRRARCRLFEQVL